MFIITLIIVRWIYLILMIFNTQPSADRLRRIQLSLNLTSKYQLIYIKQGARPLYQQKNQMSIKKRPASDKKTHYVDNVKLQAALLQYKKEYDHAKEHGLQEPRVPEYVR